LPHLDSKRVRVCDTCFIKLNMNNMNEPRQNTRDSSDSDGEENHAHYSPVPATFYQNIENF
ncbi:unnamed protein product, partial [Rotaria socialis]